MQKKFFTPFIIIIALISGCSNNSKTGKTEITKWQNGKAGAISITYDDGIRTQFSEMLPVMEQLKLPATFFVITGPIIGSNYPAKFVGRPISQIKHDAARFPTNENNFFERASAARYLGYKGEQSYYDKADELYERGKKQDAWHVMNDLYKNVRNGAFPRGKDTSMEIANEKGLSWNDLQQIADSGYEIASHTITHAHLAIMDTANMLYELRKSQQDILDHLGSKYTFSAEVPFGIDDPRVMKTAFTVYPALRNLMPEPWMTEINRGHRAQPGASDKEYVQWQRGPLSKTTLTKMKSWVDTVLSHNNIWLVLVFHGIDTVGWEPLPHDLVGNYFQFIKQHEDSLWVATFGNVARYVRERMAAKTTSKVSGDTITVTLQHSLDTSMYNFPLTLKTYVPGSWDKVQVKQGSNVAAINSQQDNNGTYILYHAAVNAKPVELTEEK